ncbi:MAG: RlmE family RNA methyltransferase [Phycisphaerales bacterium]|jgi:23S rRNA (uridine2552-2'-O)-methyltransferase|nr:RlmE family RNA methyltransferase [Phycisphaerales bacterium]
MAEREIHDHWSREAKRKGYRSRAAFKLMQIDDRRDVLTKGDQVLDLGCAPGSWLQVIAERVGPKGCGWGIDLKEVPKGLPDNVKALLGNAEDPIGAGVPQGMSFDAVLSDMMPSTTGSRDTDHFRSVAVCELALDLCAQWLRPEGTLVTKILEGAAMPQLLADVRKRFDRVKPFKPEASRKESTEIFIIAHGYKGPLAGEPDEVAAVPGPPPVPEGW